MMVVNISHRHVFRTVMNLRGLHLSYSFKAKGFTSSENGKSMKNKKRIIDKLSKSHQ